MRKISYILFLTLSCSFQFVCAQQRADWYNLNIDNGLPTNNVYSTILDSKGYLWMATDRGVVRYNGYELKIFTTSDGLPTNDVYKLIEDSSGRIWVYSLSSHFGYIKEGVYYDLPLPEIRSYIYASDVFQVGNVLFFSYVSDAPIDNRFVFLIGDKVHSIVFERDHPFMLSQVDANMQTVFMMAKDSLVSMLYLDRGNRKPTLRKWKSKIDLYYFVRQMPVVWLHARRLFLMSPGSSFFWWSKEPFQKIDSFSISKVDSSKKFHLVTTIDNKVNIFLRDKYLILDTNFQVLERRNLPTFIKGRTGWHTEVGSIEFLSTLGDGLWFSRTHESSTELPNKQQLLKERQLSLVGSYGNEGFWWDGQQSQLVSLNGSTKTVLPIGEIGTVRCVTGRPRKELLITSSQGLFVLDRERGTTRPFFDMSKNYLSYNWRFQNLKPFSLLKLGDSLKRVVTNNIHQVAEYAGDIYAIRRTDGFIQFRMPQDRSMPIISTMNVVGRSPSIVMDSFSKKIFLSNADLTTIYDPIDSVFTEVSGVTLSRLGVEKLREIVTNQRGTIFCVNAQSIIQFNLANHTSKCVERNLDLSNARVFVRDRMMVVAGNFGIAFYREENGLFSRVKLFANVKMQKYKQVLDVFIQDSSWFLLNTEAGLYRLPIPQDRAAFVPDDLFAISLTAPVSAKLRNNATYTLAPGTSKIRFDAINFLGNGTPGFRYSIDGVSESFESRFGEISLNALEPDKSYQVHLKVFDNTWISDPFIFYIKIQPYWYQTLIWQIAFWALGLSLTGAIVYSTMVITRRSVVRANERRRRQTELELRAIYAQINPHFIFNTLTTALLFISKNKNKEAYNHINNFSKLLRSYLKSSRERYISLADEIEMLRRYIELQRAKFAEPFRFDISLDNSISALHTLLPSLLLQPLVENAINHGLGTVGAQGMLHIRFKKGRSDNEIVCEIEDNGIGRQRSKALFEPYATERGSYGTDLTHDLIDIFRQYEDMDILLEYFDKTEPETGTIVRLTIKNVKRILTV